MRNLVEYLIEEEFRSQNQDARSDARSSLTLRYPPVVQKTLLNSDS
ncbi:hypothetical protein [Nostoc sp.]